MLKRITAVCILSVHLTGFVRADFVPTYQNLGGARYRNTINATWDVGWSEDVHQKRIEARERSFKAARVQAGDVMSFGRSRYPIFAAGKVDLYLFDLNTRASKVVFWLSVDDKPISSPGTVTVNGRGNYKVTLAMNGVCAETRAFLKASSTDDVSFTSAVVYVPPEEQFPSGIEGVYLLRHHPRLTDGKLADGYPITILQGKKQIRLSDFEVSGIPVPRLGMLMDIHIADRATSDFRIRTFADDGSVTDEGWRSRRSGIRIGGSGEFSAVRLFMDSRTLDSDGNGMWSPEVLRELDTLDVPAGVAWTVIVPATWFDAPASAGNPYTTLRFEHLGRGGHKNIAVPLREDYFNEDGSVRIGFVHYSSNPRPGGGEGWSVHKVYVVQSCSKGGVIVGFVDRFRDFRCLQIVKDTLRLATDGESIRPRFGKKISYAQHYGFGAPAHNISEIEAYLHGRLYNGGTCRTYRKHLYPPKLIWDDPYVRAKTKNDIDNWQRVVDLCKKYGQDFAYETEGDYVPDLVVHHAEYVAEYFNRKTGVFEKAYGIRNKGSRLKRPVLDVMNEEAVKHITAHWTELLSYFRCLPYVELAEVEYRHVKPVDRCFYSKGALASYRKYVGDPEALFPGRPDDAETDRSDNGATEKDWENFYNWQIDKFTEGRVMALTEAAWRAFKGKPFYKGLSFLQSADVTRGGDPIRSLKYGFDLRPLFKHPGFGLRVLEHGYWNDKAIVATRKEIALAKKHKKKIIMLANTIACFGPGERPVSYHKRMPYPMTHWSPEETYWLCDRLIAGTFPELVGQSWHPGWVEEGARFWMAYQTVEWDRGLMPMSEAREIMDRVKATYAQQKKDFEYDKSHVFKTVKATQMSPDFRIFATAAEEIEKLPAETLTVADSLFRGEGKGDALGAEFRTMAVGDNSLCFLVEVKDSDYTGLSSDKYTFGPGEWPEKDKVDIFLGCSPIKYAWVIGNGNSERPTHIIPTHVIWVEARCGEEQIVVYHGKGYSGGFADAYSERTGEGKAVWHYDEEAGKWSGRIRVNLDAIKKGLTVKTLTGFNFGVQDVDDGVDNVRYLLYEMYPRWVNRYLRYGDLEVVQ